MSTKRPAVPFTLHSNLNRLALLLFALGVLFALESLLNVHILSRLWPLLIASLGGGFIGIFFQRHRRESLFLGIGVYLVCFSLLALYCSFAGWNRMAVLWPLFLGFVGVSFLALYLLFARELIYLFLIVLSFSACFVFLLVFAISGHLWWLLFFFLALAVYVLGIERRT